MAKIKRSLIKTFLNTGTVGAPDWVLISPGVTTAKIGYGPKTTEEIYIHEDTGSISIDSYAPNIPIEASAVNGEDVFEYLDAKRKARSTLADAETEVVNVWLYKGAAGGLYLAEKQAVSISFDKYGGAGGQAAKLNYTINFIGDHEVGTFDPVNLAFVTLDDVAKLSSLVIASLTLTPAFGGSRIWYTSETTDATNVITAVAVDGDSVITIDVDGVTVVNEDPISWVEGLNIVTVTSTLGADTAIYYVFVTYTPAA
jgi:hypothetical protein